MRFLIGCLASFLAFFQLTREAFDETKDRIQYAQMKQRKAVFPLVLVTFLVISLRKKTLWNLVWAGDVLLFSFTQYSGWSLIDVCTEKKICIIYFFLFSSSSFWSFFFFF